MPLPRDRAARANSRYGYLGLVDGILDLLLADMGKETKVVSTGGLAPLISGGSKHIKHVDEFLTLDGLRMIWERNASSAPAKPISAKTSSPGKTRTR